MKVNRGKDFEKAVFTALKKIEATGEGSVDRLYDTMGGFAGIANICDFVFFISPHLYYLETKSVYGNTFPFANLTKHQLEGLKAKNKLSRVYGLVVIWFIDHNITVTVNISEVAKMISEGKKSINIKDVLADGDEIVYLRVPGKKKRILFEYDFKQYFVQNWEF